MNPNRKFRQEFFVWARDSDHAIELAGSGAAEASSEEYESVEHAIRSRDPDSGQHRFLFKISVEKVHEVPEDSHDPGDVEQVAPHHDGCSWRYPGK